MRKILNAPERFVDDFLEGLLRAHPDGFTAVPGVPRAIVRPGAPGEAAQVGIVTGGGSGHLPLFLGYVGKGLCSGAAVGNTFSSPSVETILAATRASSAGRGVLYLYGNYGGDNLNFDDAAEEAEKEGIETATVRASDDVASAPRESRGRRRGVAGLAFAYKCAGAAAAAGWSLERTAEVARRCLDRTRTMGVGLSPTILPEAGQATFEIGEGEMEVGIGIHGEPGTSRQPITTADEITDLLLGPILAELALGTTSRVAVLVNSLGATPTEELYIVYGRIARELEGRGVPVERALVGRYATSLEMAGCSISVLHLDEELSGLLSAEAFSPLLREL